MAYKSPFGPFLPTVKSKYIFGATVVATSSLLAYRRGFFTNAAAPEERRHNRIYLPVRHESELEPLLILKPPLLANFGVRNDPRCNQLTGALYRIATDHTEKRVSVVDIEADEPGMKDLMLKYEVNDLPSIVALRTGIPFSRFTLEKDEKVDWDKLRKWVDECADDIN